MEVEKFRFEVCEELMKVIFGSKYPPEEGKPYCKESINGKTLQSQVWDVLESITAKGRERLISRFGFKDGRAKTRKEVGREFRVTKEAIHQTEIQALRQLRHPLRSYQLEPYLENKLAQEAVAKRLQKEEEERKRKEEIERGRRLKEEEERRVREKFSQPKNLSFEERQAEIRALRRLFGKTQIASTYSYRPSRFINNIIRKGFLFSHLKTLNEEELGTLLNMPGTQTEQALLQMWRIANQRASPLD